MSDDVLTMWVIYDHPLDFPDKFVARRWVIDGAKLEPDELLLADDIDIIRQEMMKRGLTVITRSLTDDAKIVETWL